LLRELPEIKRFALDLYSNIILEDFMKAKTLAWIAAALLLAGIISACQEVEGFGLTIEEENNNGGGNKKPTVTSVTVTPGTVIILLDNANPLTQQFTAKVSGTGSFTDGVSWAVSGGSVELNEDTVIDETTGLLTVAADEEAEPLTVTATSQDDATRWAEVKVYTSLDTYLADYLADADNQDAGKTADKPIPLPVSMALTTDSWNTMLGVIDKEDKFVSLDLSACQSVEMDGGVGVFGVSAANRNKSSIGENKVVSLVLPEAAESIGGFANNIYNAEGFAALKNVDGAGVTTIDSITFSGCEALITVNFPAVTSIGYRAFEGCKALTTVNLPAVKTIDISGFYGCTALTTLTLPVDPPIIGGDIFGNRTSGDTLTIYVPSGSVGNYTAAPENGGWGVDAETEADENEIVYGYGHKKIIITDQDPPAAQ
jgi:hypothetical protein